MDNIRGDIYDDMMKFDLFYFIKLYYFNYCELDYIDNNTYFFN